MASALTCHAIAQDDCSNATLVVNGPNGPFTNVGSTTSQPAWPCGAGGSDVWYLYVPSAAGPLTADTCGASYDSVIEVFDGVGGCGALLSLACDDDTCGNLSSTVTVTVAACIPYYIRVGGFGGGTGTFTLNINGPVGPPCTTTLATVVSQGLGCDTVRASFYEEMTPAAFDLTGGTLLMNNFGSGYVVQFVPGLPPVAVGLISAPVNLALTDDSQVAAGTLGLTVGSNGWVALGGGNTNAFVPDVATLLSNPATAFYSWKDMNPTIPGSGQVKYEEAGVSARVTFDGVWDFGGTAVTANTIQFSYNAANGDMIIAWGPMSLDPNGTNTLVGYSPGGPNLDLGPTDLSTTTTSPLVTAAFDQAPISLVGVGRPVQGAAAVNFDVTTGNIPASALLHVGIIGLTRPGLPLFVIGAPNCFLNSSIDVLVGPAVGPFASTLTWTALALPALPPNFSGFEFNAQGVILGTPLNPALGLGALTSNGLKCTVGDV